MILVMGVSGVGKSTLGSALAASLGQPWVFVEGDSFHPEANIRKMSGGVALGDEDRWAWLDALRSRIRAGLARGESVVLACSALKRVYRRRLIEGVTPVVGGATGGGFGSSSGVMVVSMTGAAEEIRSALRARSGTHFMPESLLESQLAAWEPPSGEEPWIGAVVEVPAYRAVGAQVALVRDALEGPRSGLR